MRSRMFSLMPGCEIREQLGRFGPRVLLIVVGTEPLPEIEKATLRLMALRGTRNVSGASERLSMAPVSLMRWLERRSLPSSLMRKLQADD
jgi:hypothetical protein